MMTWIGQIEKKCHKVDEETLFGGIEEAFATKKIPREGSSMDKKEMHHHRRRRRPRFFHTKLFQAVRR